MRRSLVLAGVTAFVFAVHCGGSDDVSYTPEDDVRVAGALLGEWSSSDGSFRVLVCADRSALAAVCARSVADLGGNGGDGKRCHVMQADASSTRESLAPGGGCDTPGPYASLAVTALPTSTGAIGFVADTPWHGEIEIAPSGTDGYGGARDLAASTAATSEQGVVGSLGGTFSGGHLALTFTVQPTFVRQDASVADADTRNVDASDAQVDAGIVDAADADADANDGDAAIAPPPGRRPVGPVRTKVDLTRGRGAEACP